MRGFLHVLKMLHVCTGPDFRITGVKGAADSYSFVCWFVLGVRGIEILEREARNDVKGRGNLAKNPSQTWKVLFNSQFTESNL